MAVMDAMELRLATSNPFLKPQIEQNFTLVEPDICKT